MSLNPFLAPILYDLHHATGFGDLADLLLAGHLMTGHNTSFGKLIDEKILPKLLAATGTYKLNSAYRAATPPLNEACFDRIDHLVPKIKGKPSLLSLKASRWTIQLESAVGLNAGFAEIVADHSDLFDEIVVGVFYGASDKLSDKV